MIRKKVVDLSLRVPPIGSGDSHYALEKLSAAVHALAVAEGNVRDRLIEAFPDLIAVSERDLPDELRAEYRSIREELTKREARGKEGRMIATIARMRNSTGAKIALRIYNLHLRLREQLAEH
jgi:hypothetical protein